MASIYVNLAPDQDHLSVGGCAQNAKDPIIGLPTNVTTTAPSVVSPQQAAPDKNSSSNGSNRVGNEAPSADSSTVSTSHNHHFNNDVIVVYENGDFDDDDDFIFFEGRILANITKLCKLFILVFPSIIVVLVIASRSSANYDGELKKKVIEGALILSVGILFAFVYYFLKYSICKVRQVLEQLTSSGQPERDARQRQREELKLQARDPWRRKLISLPKMPYLNHVELYKETGLYKDGHRY